jgi:hypothetical protein
MKRLYFAAAVLFLGLTSCSTSNDNPDNSPNVFLPLTTSSSWVYDVNLDAANVGRDSLFVSGETTLNGNTYQQFETKDVPTGFYTNALNNNYIRKDGDQLLLSGSTGLALSDFLPINIDVTDFVLFKENASNNAELSAVSGVLEQDLQGIPLKITYTLKSIFKESLSSFTVPGKETYTNVKVIKVIANLKVTTDYVVPGLSTPLTVSVLNPQDVIVSTNYYAEGIGMIYAKTDVNFQINDFSQLGITLPIPQQGSSIIEEFLD